MSDFVNVKMLKEDHGAADGFTVRNYGKDNTYLLPAHLAACFISRGTAVEAPAEAPAPAKAPEDGAKKPQAGSIGPGGKKIKPETPEDGAKKPETKA